MSDTVKLHNSTLPSISKSLGILIGVYAGLRLVFYLFPELKTFFFVRPTGAMTALFWGNGIYENGEWIYEVGRLKIILGELCSGTTFFCLLSSYMMMKKYPLKRSSIWWLAACYPLSVLTNTARVLSSIYVHGYSMKLFSKSADDSVHLIVGVLVFFLSFIAITIFENKKVLEKYFDG